MHKQDEHWSRTTLDMWGRKKYGIFFREYTNTLGKEKIVSKAGDMEENIARGI